MEQPGALQSESRPDRVFRKAGNGAAEPAVAKVQAVRAALLAAAAPQSAETLARNFQRARTDKIAELLQTLAALGQAREVEAGKFAL